VKQVYGAIRRHPLFKDSTILWIFENNYGHVANDLTGYTLNPLNKFDNHHALCDIEGKTGIHTTAPSKLVGRQILQYAIATWRVSFLKNFIHFGSTTDGYSLPQILEMFRTQCKTLQRFTLHKFGGMPVEVIESAYDNDRQLNKNRDDLELAFIIGLNISTMFSRRMLPEDYTYIHSLQGRRKDAYHTHASAAQIAEQVHADALRRRVEEYEDAMLTPDHTFALDLPDMPSCTYPGAGRGRGVAPSAGAGRGVSVWGPGVLAATSGGPSGRGGGGGGGGWRGSGARGGGGIGRGRDPAMPTMPAMPGGAPVEDDGAGMTMS
jgi:uncharacterized membrane protein YgcG